MRVYIGIDAGWESMRYEVRNAKNQKVEKAGVSATREGLKGLLKKYEGRDVQVAFESGTQMYWMDEVVRKMGMESYPFHAWSFAARVKSRNKTDKKDAERIAERAVKKDLPSRIVLPKKGEKRLRDLLSERESYKKELTSNVNRLHAVAVSQGIRLKNQRLTEKAESWEVVIEELKGEGKARTRRLYTVALSLFQVLEEIEEKIRKVMARKDYQKAYERLTSIPGIGFWTAVVLLAWCGPQAMRFRSSRHAASYFGLVGKVHQSGTINRWGHITKAGPTIARRIFIQAAYAFMRTEEGKKSRWGEWYEQTTNGRTHRKKIAIVGLARKLVTAAVACLQKETTWKAAHLRPETTAGS